MKVMLLVKEWMSPEGDRFSPGLVDRDAYPQIPEECFWQQMPFLEVDIKRRISAAVAEEREEIAKMADEAGPDWNWFSSDIRARGSQKGEPS